MSNKYKIRNQEGIYFITFTVIEWIDVFIRRHYCDIIIESLKYCQTNKGLLLHAYCIMTSHLHLIISARDNCKLSDIIRDFKKYTSAVIIRAIMNNPRESRKRWLLKMFRDAGAKYGKNRIYQFWKQENHPVELCTNQMIDQRVDYVHNNPVKAGIVASPEYYVYSSAAAYSGYYTGLLDLAVIDD